MDLSLSMFGVPRVLRSCSLGSLRKRVSHGYIDIRREPYESSQKVTENNYKADEAGYNWQRNITATLKILFTVKYGTLYKQRF